MELRHQAQKISDNIVASGEAVSLDPLTITAILTQVLPMLFSCLRDNDDVSATSTKARVKSLYDKNPERLIRRTTLAVMKEHKRTEKKKPKSERVELSKDDARVLALAIIEQTINEDDTNVSSACIECGITEMDED